MSGNAAERAPLDASRLVVMGEGLAAGLGNFSLSRESQSASFGALLASQLGVPFHQPLLEAPGAGNVPGLPPQPVIVPAPPQGTVRGELPPPPGLSNVAVPGFRLADALRRRPLPPLVQRDDATQTLANLILGYPGLLAGGAAPLPTQLEAALRAEPTLVLIELGYAEVVAAAMAADPGLLPDPAAFGDDYSRLLAALCERCPAVLPMTVPDPLDSAFFSRLEAAARLLHTEPGFLCELYALRADDLLTLDGLVEVGYQLTARDVRPALPPGSVMAATVAGEVRRGVAALNREIASRAGARGLPVYDLHGFFHRLRRDGAAVGERRLTADYLGGIFLLNGLYPGATGHALLADDLLGRLEALQGDSLPRVDVAAVLAGDPLGQVTFPGGPVATREYLQPLRFEDLPPSPPPSMPFQPAPVREVPEMGLPEPQRLARPLELPPGLEQELPLCREASYFGDALRAVHCPHEGPGPDGLPPLGLCGDLLFGGLCLTNSRLSGSVRIRFSPPVDGVTRFTVSLPQGLLGEDGTLTAPLFLRLPSRLNAVQDFPGLVSAGDLDLATGQVTNLQLTFRFFNTAILALLGVNPNLPPIPIQFPGIYGAAAARFEPRSDGLLDFSFSGSTFLPLGTHLGPDPVRFPLPFSNLGLQCVGLPASGTSLHPHIHLTTRAPEPPAEGAAAPEIPFNTVRELSVHARRSEFGDHFRLDLPELGGEALGRSHLTGRLRVQFGERFGDAVTVALSSLPPGGLLAPSPTNAGPFAGKGIHLGLLGHDERLRFPRATYELRDVFFADDPFDPVVGAVDLRTGRFLGDLLYRGFIGQNLLFALLAVEPRTPRSSFGFRGPASLASTAGGGLVFRFDGEVLVPYPAGFKFPAPDLASGFTVRSSSRLDPFLRLEAKSAEPPAGLVVAARGEQRTASTGARFSYDCAIPVDRSGEARFEYADHERDGTFRMLTLAWVDFFASGDPEACDTVAFTAYGTWSLDREPSLHVATVQLSTSPAAPYVSILIDGGRTSNVNSAHEEPA